MKQIVFLILLQPPPSPVPKVSFDQPVQVDQPYSGDTSNANTDPFPGDPFKDDFPTDACSRYTVTYSYDAISGESVNRIENQIITLFGQIGSITATRDSNNDPQILIECQGLADYEECGTLSPRGVNTLTGAGLTVTFANPTIDNVVLVV